MREVPSKASHVQIVFFDDDFTPWDFVTELIGSVFSKTKDEAEALAALVNKQGRAVAGVYPPLVADALLAAAQERIKSAGHELVITLEPLGGHIADQACGFCGTVAYAGQTLFKGRSAMLCDDCLHLAAGSLSAAANSKQFKYAHQALSFHFAGIPAEQLVTTSRQFPGHMRADVQVALDKLFPNPLRFFGIYERQRYETLTYAGLAKDGNHAITIAPVQYQDVDIGGGDTVRCLNNGLWFCSDKDLRYALVLSFHREFGQESGMCVELAVPAGDVGSAFVQAKFAVLEKAVKDSRSYRGKVLSLETDGNYEGRSKGITVHKLPPVAREDVILPEKTLKLLDRNVLNFVARRDALRGLSLSTRKGILLYGPPGTGKTHTIRYLANNLPGHTTLIITAGQVGLLSDYMSLARLLQPALVVLEDVDLIARSREEMASACEESMLNKLLNEMDGLKEDADIVFVLTTNRPQDLEAALAGRPGRIDQAIEVPLPDEHGREKLVRLYGRGLKLDGSLVQDAVKRTAGVSAAFIKELMRRTAQASVERGAGAHVTSADITEALDDMLFSGGKLNIALLGGAMAIDA